ncbi:MAG: helix-turn-helix domain-containing protein [Planctomycetota bacterium]|jgi:hypothetical protein
MRIEFQLKAVLQCYGLDKTGIFSRIERETGISRRIVSGLYYNRRVGVTMNQLERLCQWLHNQDVPSEELPGALFRFSPSGLMNALTIADRVRIYSGLYFQRQASHMPKYWVSSADSEVASLFIETLSSVAPVDNAPTGPASSTHGHKGPRIEHILVPSHDAPFGGASETERPAPESTMPARKIFRAMREDKAPTTNILIGSQRANLLVELFVADLFGCEPFAESRGRLPFYLYREPSTSSLMPSCCGGPDQPADCPGSGPFGIYFRRKGQRWELCPSIPNETDAGIVIVRRAPGQGQTELAVFGCSALATRAMGELLRRDPDQFWGSLQRLKGGIEARVYVCRLSMRAATEVTGPRPNPVLDDAEVYPLELEARARPK